MIEIKTYNESEKECDVIIHIEGNLPMVVLQLSSIFDGIYEMYPKLFETVLLNCQYTEDHT